MIRWLPVVLLGLASAAPVAARANTSAPDECVLALPGKGQLGVAGQPIAYSQGIFCVPNEDTLSDPVIEWGDGTTSPGTIAAREAGRVVITGAHVYRSPGMFEISARVTDVANGQSYSAGSEMEADIRPEPVLAMPPPSEAPASVPDPPTSSSVSAVGCDFAMRRGSPVRSREVALIRTRIPSAGLRATISWGDGTKSAGAVTGTGTLRVNGRHRWRHSGRYSVIVALTDASHRVVAKATCRAIVVPG